MDRRSFLMTTSSAAAAAATPLAAAADPTSASPCEPAVAAPAIHAGLRDVVLALPWRDTISGPGDQAMRLARRLEATLDRGWRIIPRHLADGGISAIAAGEADLYFGSECENAVRHPAFAFFSALPGAGTLNADHLSAWLHIGGGQDLWDDLAAEFDVKPLLAGHLGRWPGLWSAQPIESLADLAGQRIAVEGLARDVVHGLGAVPVRMPAEDMAEALRRGDIAAAEYGGALMSLALGLPRAARHLNGFGILEGGMALSLGIRRALWDSLGERDRAIVSAVVAEAREITFAELRAHEKPLRSLLRESLGVTFSPFPSDVAMAIDRVSEAVVADLDNIDATARRINRSYHAFRNAAWGLETGALEAGTLETS